MGVLRTKRILVAAEFTDGSAVVYQLDTSDGLVVIEPEDETERLLWFREPLMPDPRNQRWVLTAKGRFLEMHRVVASDYFEPQPEIAPPTPALNP